MARVRNLRMVGSSIVVFLSKSEGYFIDDELNGEGMIKLLNGTIKYELFKANDLNG
jgi:hypothetical protein